MRHSIPIYFKFNLWFYKLLDLPNMNFLLSIWTNGPYNLHKFIFGKSNNL